MGIVTQAFGGRKISFQPAVAAAVLVLFCQSTVRADSLIPMNTPADAFGTVWILMAAILVFAMQAGFLCLESGFCRKKNSINTAVKNLSNMLLSVSVYWFIGFGLMFGVSQLGLWGTSFFVFNPPPQSLLGASFVFYAACCCIAVTIGSAAAAERTRFSVYLFMSILISACVFPVFGHWAWASLLNGENTGWLESIGFIDVAGSTVMHSVGAWVALAAAILVGARKGKYDANGNAVDLRAQNDSLAYLGVFVLLLGWFGLICGNPTGFSKDIGTIAMNTIMAATFGGLVAGAISWLRNDLAVPGAKSIANGILGGLVAVTACCSVITPSYAILVGALAGVVVWYGERFLMHYCKIDDVVGVVSVHGFCGVWGTLAVALFIRPDLLAIHPVSSRYEFFSIQLLGVVTCFLWTFGLAFIALWTLRMFTSLRVSEEDEVIGLDISNHGASSTLFDLSSSMQKATSSGVYDGSLKVDGENGTEAGDLAQCFNRMIDSIEQQRMKTEQAVESLRSQRNAAQLGLEKYRVNSENIVSVVDDQLKDLEVMVTRSDESAEMLLNSVETIFDGINRMIVSFDQSLRSQTWSDARSEETLAEADHDVETIERISGLSVDVEEIFMSLQEVTQQIQLLSVNASVEALKAGDAGFGCGVVAGQIQRLARESTNSANAASRCISRIRTDADDAQQSVTHTRELVGKICEETSQVSRLLGESVSDQKVSSRHVQNMGVEVQEMVSELLDGLQQIRQNADTTRTQIRGSYEELQDVLQQAGLTTLLDEE